MKKSGFFATLSPEQQERVLKYRGPDSHGAPMLARPIRFASEEERAAYMKKLRKELMIKFKKTLDYLAKH